MDDKMKPGIRNDLDNCVPEMGMKIIADWLYKAHFDETINSKIPLNREVEKTEQAS